jgi:hypothetical protein
MVARSRCSQADPNTRAGAQARARDSTAAPRETEIRSRLTGDPLHRWDYSFPSLSLFQIAQPSGWATLFRTS